MAAAAKTPTTTPAATPATFVPPPPPSDFESSVGLLVALASATWVAGCVTTTVVPGAALVTTIGAWVVVA